MAPPLGIRLCLRNRVNDRPQGLSQNPEFKQFARWALQLSQPDETLVHACRASYNRTMGCYGKSRLLG